MNVVFDGENLLIKVNNEVTTLDIQIDLYSDWKEWMCIADNSKFLPALRTVAGDPTVQGKTIAPYFFLMNGWKIKPASWTHTLNLIGNLFVDDPGIYGSNIVVPPDGDYTVLVNMSTTSDASKLVVGSGVTQQDKEDIADLVEAQTGVPIKGKVGNIETHHIGRVKLEEEYMLIYNDLEELVAKYELIKDSKGRIIERIPQEI